MIFALMNGRISKYRVRMHFSVSHFHWVETGGNRAFVATAKASNHQLQQRALNRSESARHSCEQCRAWVYRNRGGILFNGMRDLSKLATRPSVRCLAGEVLSHWPNFHAYLKYPYQAASPAEVVGRPIKPLLGSSEPSDLTPKALIVPSPLLRLNNVRPS
jgi:hypothetical protein